MYLRSPFTTAQHCACSYDYLSARLFLHYRNQIRELAANAAVSRLQYVNTDTNKRLLLREGGGWRNLPPARDHRGGSTWPEGQRAFALGSASPAPDNAHQLTTRPVKRPRHCEATRATQAADTADTGVIQATVHVHRSISPAVAV